MSTPGVTTLELPAIEAVLEMERGYVLDFENRTFARFFEELGIDIDQDFPEGSKAKRLRAFLCSAEPPLVARVLEALLERREALLERRGERDEGESSPQLIKYKNVIARLRGAKVALPTRGVRVDVLSLAYVHELEAKTEQRLAASDLEGAITTARTMLEAVLHELEYRLIGQRGDYEGNLQRLFKAVAKQLRVDHERADLDDDFKQVARGLVSVVNGLAPIRNKMSDGHPRQRKPAAHHARMIVNASKTVSVFLIESYLFQREKGLLPKTPNPQETTA